MDEWGLYQEMTLSFWKNLERASWWSFDSLDSCKFHVLAKALPDPARFAIVLTDLRNVWTCEGGEDAIAALHTGFNRGLETDTRGMIDHIDKIIGNFDPAANYSFAAPIWKAKTLLANVFRFQCEFVCTQTTDFIARNILNVYLFGALTVVIRTQEIVMERQQVVIRTLEGGRGKQDLEGEIRRLAQETRKTRISLGPQPHIILGEVFSGENLEAEDRVKRKEQDLKRKRLEDLQRAEQAKKPKTIQVPQVKKAVGYQETEEEGLRRQELAQKLQKAEVKKKTKKMDFL